MKNKRIRKRLAVIMAFAMLTAMVVPMSSFAAQDQQGEANGQDSAQTHHPPWQVSKSKTAENLDEALESEVTLSLPSAEEPLATDVVFVLDKSTSADVEEEAIGMLTELSSKAADIKVGIVIFNKTSNKVLQLTKLDKTTLADIEAAIRTEIKSGTNSHAGLIAGRQMLDDDKTVDPARKYLIFVSDGITYMFNEEPTAVSWSFDADETQSWCGPDNWYSKYGDNQPPEDWNKWMKTIEAQIAGDGTKYDYPYGGKAGSTTPVSEASQHAMSVDKALYLTAQEYNKAQASGYNCYAMRATDVKGSQYLWGPSFMEYLSGGTEVSFDSIRNDIYYLVDSGSKVVDEIGETEVYNFDFINDVTRLKLTVGGEVKDAVKLSNTEYGFGSLLDSGNYEYTLTYHAKGTQIGSRTFGECFVWDINVPVTIDSPVQLTYAVKLMNPQTEAGVYGEYDRDGSQGKDALCTNNSAVLYPVDSSGSEGQPEEFAKPTVSYTVETADPTDPPNPSDEPSSDTGDSDSTQSDEDQDNPQTGDRFSFAMCAAFILSAIIGMLVAACVKREKTE